MDAALDLSAPLPVPAAPPRSWFEEVPDWYDPEGPLVQIDRNSGRVAAMVAPYSECILDGTAGCWKPPESPTGYAFAHVGGMVCDDGKTVRVANVGGGVPHAPMTGSSSMAQSHYADTTTRRMVGRYVDRPDRGGILFIGSMWPGTTVEHAIECASSALSGDWRWIQSVKGYDLCGSQLVNNPGFRPVPGRPHVAAFGVTMGQPRVAAAGVVEAEAIRGEWHSIEAPLTVGQQVAERAARVAAAAFAMLDDEIEDLALPEAVIDDPFDQALPEPLGVDLSDELAELDDQACNHCAGEGCDACGHLGYPEPHVAAAAGRIGRKLKTGAKGGLDALGFWHDPNSGKFAERGYVSPQTLRRLMNGDQKAFSELRAKIAEKNKPGLSRNRLAHDVLGPQPKDAAGRNGWMVGFREVSKAHAARPKGESDMKLKDKVKRALKPGALPATPLDHPDGNQGKAPSKRADGTLTLNYVWSDDPRAYIPDVDSEPTDRQQAADAAAEELRAAVAKLPPTSDPVARSKALDDLLGVHAKSGPIATDAIHNQLGENSDQWTEERRALHRRIIDDVMQRIEEAGIPKDRRALFLGGLPGAGKSTALADETLGGELGYIPAELEKDVFAAGANAVALNPDAFKEILAKMDLAGEDILPDTGLKPMENATFMHAESSMLEEMLEERLLDEGYNIVYDGTMANEKSARRKLATLLERDYNRPDGLFVKISREESEKSAAGRYERAADTEMGGRFVPSAISKEAEPPEGYEDSSANHAIFDLLASERAFESGLVVDNAGVSERKAKRLAVAKIDDSTVTDYEDIAAPQSHLRSVDDVHKMDGVGGGTGTEKDPFMVSDMGTAVALLGDGQYHVRLSRPEEVATLLDEMAQVAKVAKDKGDDAPTFDLCKLSVPKTNVFCAKSQGYPRIEMPQLATREPVKGSPADRMKRDKDGSVDLGPLFLRHLEDDKGVTSRVTTKQASHLRASQNELNGSKVSSIMQKGAPDGTIFVTSDGYVVDGHHRWAAAVGQSYKKGSDVDLAVTEIDADILTVLKWAVDFTTEMGSPPQTASIGGSPEPPIWWDWKEDT